MIAGGKISAILSFTDYLACVSCNGHVNTVNETIGKCTNVVPLLSYQNAAQTNRHNLSLVVMMAKNGS